MDDWWYGVGLCSKARLNSALLKDVSTTTSSPPSAPCCPSCATGGDRLAHLLSTFRESATDVLVGQWRSEWTVAAICPSLGLTRGGRETDIGPWTTGIDRYVWKEMVVNNSKIMLVLPKRSWFRPMVISSDMRSWQQCLLLPSRKQLETSLDGVQLLGFAQLGGRGGGRTFSCGAFRTHATSDGSQSSQISDFGLFPCQAFWKRKGKS